MFVWTVGIIFVFLLKSFKPSLRWGLKFQDDLTADEGLKALEIARDGRKGGEEVSFDAQK